MTDKHLAHTVSPMEDGTRLDALIPKVFPDLSRSFTQKLIESDCVTIDGKPATKKQAAKVGQAISITLPPADELDAIAENIPLDVIFEDEHLLVVNKPKGMVVHPAPGNHSGTLVNALMHHCRGNLSGINGVIRPGIVHRIDKDTSGLLVVAKTDTAHHHLAAQIKAHTVERTYEAVVHGYVKEAGVVNKPIGRNPKDRKKMCVTMRNSREAVTHFQPITQSSRQPFTLVRLQLETGRTHQIRVHMTSIGHPVAGDAVYGPKKPVSTLNGQCLHAKSLGFIHPATGNECRFDSNLPPYFTDFLEQIAIDF